MSPKWTRETKGSLVSRRKNEVDKEDYLEIFRELYKPKSPRELESVAVAQTVEMRTNIEETVVLEVVEAEKENMEEASPLRRSNRLNKKSSNVD